MLKTESTCSRRPHGAIATRNKERATIFTFRGSEVTFHTVILRKKYPVQARRYRNPGLHLCHLMEINSGTDAPIDVAQWLPWILPVQLHKLSAIMAARSSNYRTI